MKKVSGACDKTKTNKVISRVFRVRSCCEKNSYAYDGYQCYHYKGYTYIIIVTVLDA